MIYGIMDAHLLFWHASNSANSSMTGRSQSESPKNNESRTIYPDGQQETRYASGRLRINVKKKHYLISFLILKYVYYLIFNCI